MAGDWSEWLPRVVQGAAAATVAIVAVLTYSRAKKTVLQPLRTEAFKLRIDAIRDLLGLLADGSQLALARTSGLDSLVTLNAAHTYLYRSSDLGSSRSDPEFRAEMQSVEAAYGIAQTTSENDLDLRASTVMISRDFEAHQSKLHAASIDPMIPHEVHDSVAEYSATLESAVSEVRSLNTELTAWLQKLDELPAYGRYKAEVDALWRKRQPDLVTPAAAIRSSVTSTLGLSKLDLSL